MKSVEVQCLNTTSAHTGNSNPKFRDTAVWFELTVTPPECNPALQQPLH